MNLVSALILNTFVDEWSKAKVKFARRRAFLGTPSVSLFHEESTFGGNGFTHPEALAITRDAQGLTPLPPTHAQQQWAFQR
jgi:hypothetical protein